MEKFLELVELKRSGLVRDIGVCHLSAKKYTSLFQSSHEFKPKFLMVVYVRSIWLLMAYDRQNLTQACRKMHCGTSVMLMALSLLHSTLVGSGGTVHLKAYF